MFFVRSADSHTHQEAFKTQERLARFRERRIGSPHLLHQGEQFAPNGAGPLHESVGQFVAGVTAVAEGRNIEVPQTVEEKLVEVLALGKDVFLQEPLPNIFGACVGTVAHDAGDALQDETQSQFPTIVFARSALIGTLLFRLGELFEDIAFGARFGRPLHDGIKMFACPSTYVRVSGKDRFKFVLRRRHSARHAVEFRQTDELLPRLKFIFDLGPERSPTGSLVVLGLSERIDDLLLDGAEAVDDSTVFLDRRNVAHHLQGIGADEMLHSRLRTIALP